MQLFDIDENFDEMEKFLSYKCNVGYWRRSSSGKGIHFVCEDNDSVPDMIEMYKDENFKGKCLFDNKGLKTADKLWYSCKEKKYVDLNKSELIITLKTRDRSRQTYINKLDQLDFVYDEILYFSLHTGIKNFHDHELSGYPTSHENDTYLVFKSIEKLKEEVEAFLANRSRFFHLCC